MAKALGVLAFAAYMVAGVVAIFAIVDQLSAWLGVPSVIAFIIAIFTAYIPLVGAVIGFLGATNVWGWHWFWAALLFFGPMALYAAVGGIGALFTGVAAITAHFSGKLRRRPQ